MTLLGTFIDVRTLAAIATQSSATFAHGLGAAPDFVFVQQEVAATLSSASVGQYACGFDATNVTVYNVGQVNGTPTTRVISIRAHSIIQ